MVKRRAVAGRVATGVALIGVVLVAVVAASAWRADAAYQRALSAEREEVHPAAAQSAERAVELMPWWPKYWYDGSRLVAESAGFERSMVMLEEAIARDPRYVHARLALARAHSRQGELGEAVQVYEGLVQLDPLTPRYLAEYGEALARNGDPAEAVDWLHAALEHRSDPQYWLVLGRAYEDLERTQHAINAYEQVLATAAGDTPQNIVDEAREKLESLSG